MKGLAQGKVNTEKGFQILKIMFFPLCKSYFLSLLGRQHQYNEYVKKPIYKFFIYRLKIWQFSEILF